MQVSTEGFLQLLPKKIRHVTVLDAAQSARGTPRNDPVARTCAPTLPSDPTSRRDLKVSHHESLGVIRGTCLSVRDHVEGHHHAPRLKPHDAISGFLQSLSKTLARCVDVHGSQAISFRKSSLRDEVFDNRRTSFAEDLIRLEIRIGVPQRKHRDHTSQSLEDRAKQHPPQAGGNHGVEAMTHIKIVELTAVAPSNCLLNKNKCVEVVLSGGGQRHHRIKLNSVWKGAPGSCQHNSEGHVRQVLRKSFPMKQHGGTRTHENCFPRFYVENTSDQPTLLAASSFQHRKKRLPVMGSIPCLATFNSETGS